MKKILYVYEQHFFLTLRTYFVTSTTFMLSNPANISLKGVLSQKSHVFTLIVADIKFEIVKKQLNI